MPSARAGQAGKDCRSLAGSLIANEQTVFTIKTDSLHFAFTDVIVYWDGAVRREHVQFIPLVQSVAHRLGHRMFRQQLIAPTEEFVLQC